MEGSKFVRFQEWNSDQPYSSENQYYNDDGFYSRRLRPIFTAIGGSIHRGFETGSQSIKKWGKTVSLKPKFGGKGKGETVKKNGIIDPQGSFLQKWNKIFVLACFVAVSIDPLFFYIPVIDDLRTCLDLDKKMETTACVLRTIIDMFYVVHMAFQFRTGYIAPYTRVFGRGELVNDPFLVAKRYFRSNFIIDLLSILPLPQIVVLVIIPSLDGQVSLVGKDILKFVIWLQYIPRIGRMIPLFKQVTTSSGILTETAWAGAAYNLFLYMLASHILGAFWYLFSVERQDTCWRRACKDIQGCNTDELYCNHKGSSSPQLKYSCPFIKPEDIKNSTDFNFGIFIDALDSGIVKSWDFPKKFFYCFWWGLRNLSSLGQNLKTSTSVWEIVFAVSIAIAGLVLFALLIGNMQKYLESTTKRIEEMRVKRQDAEQWMSHRMLPEHLRKRIRRYEQYKWQETRGVEEQNLINTLPKDLRREINHHLCYDLIMKVPMFEKMDGQILDAICDRLRPVLYIKDSYITQEGEPEEEMIFIMRGDLVSATTNGGRTGFFNEVYLKASDYCGEGLLSWALDPQSTSNLPISTRTVRALTEVEAFALVADDLKSVASQFRRLQHKDIQHAFKFFSVQWKTWAACFIQAAWRRYCRRKQAKALREAEERFHGVLANEAASAPSLGATIYASQFAANVLRNLRQNGGRATTLRLPQPHRLALVPQKPPEPDFSSL